jgi:hypothetical protein
MNRNRFSRPARPSRWLPEPGPLVRELAGLYCPCGAIRGTGNVVCARCLASAPAHARETYQDHRTRRAGVRLLLDHARAQHPANRRPALV